MEPRPTHLAVFLTCLNLDPAAMAEKLAALQAQGAVRGMAVESLSPEETQLTVVWVREEMEREDALALAELCINDAVALGGIDEIKAKLSEEYAAEDLT